MVAARAGTNAASKAAAMRATAQKHEGRRIKLAHVVACAREKAAKEETTHLAYAPPTALQPHSQSEYHEHHAARHSPSAMGMPISLARRATG